MPRRFLPLALTLTASVACEPLELQNANAGWRAAIEALAPSVENAGEPSSAPEPEGVLTHRDAPPHERSSPPVRKTGLQDAALMPYRSVLDAHFEGADTKDLRVQSIDLAGDRRSLLVQLAKAPHHPIIVTTEPNGVLSWTKERPLAGMVDDIEHLSLLPGPDGGIALFLVAASKQSVGARMWNGDGGIISDFHLLDVPDVLDLAALYAPTAGWIVAASSEGGVRMQRLDEEGRIELDRSGRGVGLKTIVSEAIALARDDDASFILLQLGPPTSRSGKRARRHLFASRFDVMGEPLWPRPLEVGTVTASGPVPSLAASVDGAQVRIEVRTERASLLRAWVGSNRTFERELAGER